MSCGGDHLYARDTGRFEGEEALPDLAGPQERGPLLTCLQVVTTGVEGPAHSGICRWSGLVRRSCQPIGRG